MRNVIVIAHNLRSTHNVGSLLRTAEGIGARQVYLTGYTPHPATDGDQRLPHIQRKLTNAIHKTALGAESSIPWTYSEELTSVIEHLQDSGYTIAALEQTASSLSLPNYTPPQKIALLLGREVEGIEPEVLKLCDICLEIPMAGKKESFNVVQAAAMALYHCIFA